MGVSVSWAHCATTVACPPAPMRMMGVVPMGAVSSMGVVSLKRQVVGVEERVGERKNHPRGGGSWGGIDAGL